MQGAVQSPFQFRRTVGSEQFKVIRHGKSDRPSFTAYSPAAAGLTTKIHIIVRDQIQIIAFTHTVMALPSKAPATRISYRFTFCESPAGKSVNKRMRQHGVTRFSSFRFSDLSVPCPCLPQRLRLISLPGRQENGCLCALYHSLRFIAIH